MCVCVCVCVCVRACVRACVRTFECVRDTKKMEESSGWQGKGVPGLIKVAKKTGNGRGGEARVM